MPARDGESFQGFSFSGVKFDSFSNLKPTFTQYVEKRHAYLKKIFF